MLRNSDMVYKCMNEGCGKEFNSEKQLSLHQIYTEGKVVCCKECKLICEDNDIYISHMADKHPGCPVVMKSIHRDTMNVFDGLSESVDDFGEFYLDLWDKEKFGRINGKIYIPPSLYLPPLSVMDHFDEIYGQDPNAGSHHTIFRADSLNRVITSLTDSASCLGKLSAWGTILSESTSVQVDMAPTYYGDLLDLAVLLEETDKLFSEPIHKSFHKPSNINGFVS